MTAPMVVERDPFAEFETEEDAALKKRRGGSMPPLPPGAPVAVGSLPQVAPTPTAADRWRSATEVNPYSEAMFREDTAGAGWGGEGWNADQYGAALNYFQSLPSFAEASQAANWDPRLREALEMYRSTNPSANPHPGDANFGLDASNAPTSTTPRFGYGGDAQGAFAQFQQAQAARESANTARLASEAQEQSRMDALFTSNPAAWQQQANQGRRDRQQAAYGREFGDAQRATESANATANQARTRFPTSWVQSNTARDATGNVTRHDARPDPFSQFQTWQAPQQNNPQQQAPSFWQPGTTNPLTPRPTQRPAQQRPRSGRPYHPLYG